MNSRQETDHKTLYKFERITNGIAIHITPMFVDQDSRPDEHSYLWAYQVRIENQSTETMKILDRQWSVVDGQGMSQFISGAGVFADHPVLKPGDAFEYTNTILLQTTSGLISGRYVMKVDSGDVLEIEAPLFSLDSPYETKLLN